MEGVRKGERSQFFDREAEDGSGEGRMGGKEGGGHVPFLGAMLAPGSCMTVTVQDVLISCVPLVV